ncbi:MAG TPA: CheB methylesterase domain-containing protein, partial [Polyangiaceae bacterium]|nr:CheB methylesterase domain-containing protein [Polyangiaceae bacterium]
AALPPGLPPVVIVQHMPAYITKPFADRLQQLSRLRVDEARDGELLEPGNVRLAEGGKHLLVERVGGQLRLRVNEGPRVNGHRPSVDVLFQSTAQAVKNRAIGVLLTGMGRDGAQGLLTMRRAGAYTFAQDEASSAIFGMPRAAIELGAVSEVVAPRHLPTRLIAALSTRSPAASAAR